MNACKNKSVSGLACSGGIGIGNVVLIREYPDKKDASHGENPQLEIERLKEAAQKYKAHTLLLADKVEAKLGRADADIIRSHIAIAEDPEANVLVRKLISSGQSAEEAVSGVSRIYFNMFQNSEDPLLSQRAADILDIRDSLLDILTGGIQYEQYAEGSVLAGKDIPPSLVSGLLDGKIAGIVSENGNETSHCAILAKALRIPMVSGIGDIYDVVSKDDKIIVDGIAGEIIIEPDEDMVLLYEKRRKEYTDKISRLREFAGKETKTVDGCKLSILCNISGINDLRKVKTSDGEGIGLFRTEMLFMASTKAPAEEEQFSLYRAAALQMDGKPLVIRTLDAGGDKEIPYLDFPEEENPFLGIRGIRFSLKEQKLFRTQLRAILRASAYGDIKILIPMISCVEEFVSVKEVIKEIKTGLDKEGIAYKRDIQTGCMIETPSAALMADELAKEADFFSVGTNDLIQYTMCADRGNSSVSYLYSAM